MAPPQSSAPCRGFAISQLPHGSRRGVFSSALTSSIRSTPGSPLLCRIPRNLQLQLAQHAVLIGPVERHVVPRVEPRKDILQPEGPKIVAHGVSRGNEGGAESPREGAEDGAVAIFRPVPGLCDLAASPRLTPWAILFRSYELELGARLASQFLQASFSGELFGFVIIPSGPASSRTIRLMRTACSRQVDLRPGNGAELRKSPAVPSHRLASTPPTGSLTQTGPASTDTRIPDAEAFGLARGVWWCPACLTLDFTPQPAAPHRSPRSPPPSTGIPAPPPPHPPAPRFACRRSRPSPPDGAVPTRWRPPPPNARGARRSASSIRPAPGSASGAVPGRTGRGGGNRLPAGPPPVPASSCRPAIRTSSASTRSRRFRAPGNTAVVRPALPATPPNRAAAAT